MPASGSGPAEAMRRVLTDNARAYTATPFPDAASRLPIRRWTEQLRPGVGTTRIACSRRSQGHCRRSTAPC